jgi:hypothetical protein
MAYVFRGTCIFDDVDSKNASHVTFITHHRVCARATNSSFKFKFQLIIHRTLISPTYQTVAITEMDQMRLSLEMVRIFARFYLDLTKLKDGRQKYISHLPIRSSFTNLGNYMERVH